MPQLNIFESGELVFHRNYRYRGVIYGFDNQFIGADSWYLNNNSQPDKSQPWYHVLVDGGMHTTYVAESNLEPDVILDNIHHPLVDKYFDRFENGKYY